MNTPHESICAVLFYQKKAKTKLDKKIEELTFQKYKSIFPYSKYYSNQEREECILVKEGGSLLSCLKALLEEYSSVEKKEESHIAISYGYYPFLDPTLVAEALEEHIRYLAHFSYGENIPFGFLPDIASLDFIEELPDTWEEEKIGIDDGFRAFVLKNIQKYDVEIFYKNPDLRQYRLDLSGESATSQKIIQLIYKREPNLNYEKLYDFIQRYPEVLHPYPVYFEIELSNRSELKPFYWPPIEDSRLEKKDLDLALLDKLKEDIQKHAPLQGVTLSLGGLGEPLLHPHWLDVLASFLKLEQIECIYFETFGIELVEEKFEAILKLPFLEKLHIIFRLSTLKKDRYEQIYGADKLAHILANSKAIEKRLSKGKKEKLSIFMLKF